MISELWVSQKWSDPTLLAFHSYLVYDKHEISSLEELAGYLENPMIILV